jgi:hypothetical protein
MAGTGFTACRVVADSGRLRRLGIGNQFCEASAGGSVTLADWM